MLRLSKIYTVVLIIMLLSVGGVASGAASKKSVFPMMLTQDIEKIEFAAIERNIGSFAENIPLKERMPLNVDIPLSKPWPLEQIVSFYEEGSEVCRPKVYDGARQITCDREVDTEFGKFRIIITFREKPGSVSVVGYMAVRSVGWIW